MQAFTILLLNSHEIFRFLAWLDWTAPSSASYLRPILDLNEVICSFLCVDRLVIWLLNAGQQSVLCRFVSSFSIDLHIMLLADDFHRLVEPIRARLLHALVLNLLQILFLDFPAVVKSRLVRILGFHIVIVDRSEGAACVQLAQKLLSLRPSHPCLAQCSGRRGQG